MRVILYAICIIIPFLYTVVFKKKYNIKKTNRKMSKKKKNLLKIMRRNVLVIFIILFIISEGILFINKFNKDDTSNDKNITETTTNETEGETEMKEETTTTVETTTTKASTTTTKATTVASDSSKYKKLSMVSGTVTDKGTTSKGYKIQEVNGITYIDGYMIANKTYSLPSDYNPGFSSTVDSYLSDLIAAAKAAGYNLKNQSGFRSYSTQSKIYNNYVSNDGKANADTYSARPGHSEHQTGYALDFCDTDYDSSYCITSKFNDTKAAKWLSANAWKYGFILRYVNGKTSEHGYKYESWHFRYVGYDLSSKLYNNGDWITMESYFGFTSTYSD